MQIKGGDTLNTFLIGCADLFFSPRPSAHPSLSSCGLGGVRSICRPCPQTGALLHHHTHTTRLLGPLLLQLQYLLIPHQEQFPFKELADPS